MFTSFNKKCSKCNFEITPAMKNAYDNEWCPGCGYKTKEYCCKHNNKTLIYTSAPCIIQNGDTLINKKYKCNDCGIISFYLKNITY